MLTSRLSLVVIVAGGFVASTTPHAAAADGWSEQQVSKLPPNEQHERLFNGTDLTGWEGQTGKYFNVKDGVIVAKNGADDAPKASTYLVTKKYYRNFRLIFESKLVESEMHSGIALWGKAVEKSGDPFSYQGHLVMYPSAYGYYDLYGRNSIYKDALGVAKKAGRQHDWNQMEILAIGSRIRHVINGQLVADWTDPLPDACQAGPIGLQLHSNNVPQEVWWRGLIVSENPADRLVTAERHDTGLLASAKPAESGVDAKKLAEIPIQMGEFVGKNQISGAVTLVARRGRIVALDAVGLADIEARREMRPDTLFAIASMTKPITATAVMILVDEGKLSLDDRVAKHVPAFKDVKLKEGGKSPVREMTIRHLLSHTSGLGGSQVLHGSLAQAADEIAQRPLEFEPGTQWLYGPSLTVCGRIIEIVSGQPYADFVDARIVRPLAMKDTTFSPSPEQRGRLAQIYQPSEDKQRLESTSNFILEFSTEPNPSGGLYSTASDLARFYQMVLNGGELDGQRIVSAQAVKQMISSQTADMKAGFLPGSAWGLGWGLVRQPQGETRMLSPGAYGHGGAFGTQGWVDPEQEAIYVLLVQRAKFGNADESALRGAFQQLAADAMQK